MAFWLRTDGKFLFIPGQYALFELSNPPHTDQEGNDRAFSIASSPSEQNRIMIATRMRPTAFKNSLKEIPLGTPLKVEGPAGSFTLYKDQKKPAVFLAGGIGITPFRSMIAHATEQKSPQKLTLFYSNKTAKQTAFLSDFESWAKQNKNFSFVPTVTGPDASTWKYETGRISKELIQKHVQDLETPIFYVAGPPAMVAGLRETLVAAGVPEDSIRTEDFSGY